MVLRFISKGDRNLYAKVHLSKSTVTKHPEFYNPQLGLLGIMEKLALSAA
ncbi:MAG: hypothetical protein V7K24_06980 [Nostoc sp.]